MEASDDVTATNRPVSSANITLPNFLFIGADKCGSTWLYRVLDAHPQCFVPRAKDIYFFDRYYNRGWDWYLRFFCDAPPRARAIGELSHDYLYSSAAAQRISNDLPDVKIIVFLRDPVERSFSEYLYLIRSGLVRGSFWDCLRSHPEVLDHSCYASHLPAYLEAFPRSHVGIFFFEDLARDPAALSREIFSFLGVDAIDVAPIHERALSAGRPRSPRLARAMKRAADFTRWLGLANVVGAVKSSRVASFLYRPYSAADRPCIDDSTRLRLAAHFERDVVELEALIGMECTRWLRSE